ncbi:MAG: response regulator [Pseudomonadota bacterium]
MAKKVMIIEDNPLNMRLFNDLVRSAGYETVTTDNGLDALDIARDAQPDLVILDVQLPEVSGLDVARWFKAEDSLKDVPIIAVTAFAMKGDEERVRASGVQDYMSKPIAVADFLKAVKGFLEND